MLTFDLTFLVVIDLFSCFSFLWGNTTQDLKERYYTIIRKLMEIKNAGQKDLSKSSNPIFKHPYNKGSNKNKNKTNKQPKLPNKQNKAKGVLTINYILNSTRSRAAKTMGQAGFSNKRTSRRGGEVGG